MRRIATFGLALVWGAWRVRFNNLLPVILAHACVSATASIIPLSTLYSYTPLLAKPEIQAINRISYEPTATAVPLLLRYLSDRDADVRGYATAMLLARDGSSP